MSLLLERMLISSLMKRKFSLSQRLLQSRNRLLLSMILLRKFMRMLWNKLKKWQRLPLRNESMSFP